MPSPNDRRDFTQLPDWLNQAVADFHAHNYRPFAHYILIMGDAAIYIKRLQKALMDIGTYQGRVYEWILTCFGIASATDKQERSDRFAEEAIELLQALGYNRERLNKVIDYVYTRPPGHPNQEVGGVMVTLSALCSAAGITLAVEAETELERVWTKIPEIQAKRAAKPSLEGK